MHMRLTSVLTGCALRGFLAALSAIAALSGDPATAADNLVGLQYAFVRSLYREGRHFECIAETRRLMGLLPAAHERELEHFINVNYYLAGQYRTVVRNLQARNEKRDNDALMLYSQALARLGSYAEAVRVLNDAASPPGRAVDGELFVRSVEIRLLAGDFASAYEKAREGAALHPDSVLPSLRDRLASHDALASRSRSLAAALSAVFPGAGQAYAGRTADALLSAAAVLALGAGSVLTWRAGHRGVAFTLGFFTALAYGGGIYGAWNAAGEYNRSQNERFASEAQSLIPEYRPYRNGDLPGPLR